MKTQNRPFFDDEQPCDEVELDVEDAFGDHNIEYWVRRGNKLVPATDDEVAQIYEWEREGAAQARLARWMRVEAYSHAQSARPLHSVPLRSIMWVRHLLGRGHRPAGAGSEQEQRSRSPVKPAAARGHDPT